MENIAITQLDKHLHETMFPLCKYHLNLIDNVQINGYLVDLSIDKLNQLPKYSQIKSNPRFIECYKISDNQVIFRRNYRAYGVPNKSTYSSIKHGDIESLLNIDLNNLNKLKLSEIEEQNIFKLINLNEKPNLLANCSCDCKVCSDRGHHFVGNCSEVCLKKSETKDKSEDI